MEIYRLFIIVMIKKRGQSMNYIVFDLEWNQCPDGKEKEIKDMPFEIIEIGAVKLDSQRRVIDTLQKYSPRCISDASSCYAGPYWHNHG